MKFLPLHVRRLSYVWRSPQLWRRRAVFWLGAIGVGLSAAGFAIISDWATDLFFLLRGQSLWWTSAITIFGFILSAEITRRLAPGARGSGIPQAIAARRRESMEDRAKLIGFKVTAIKVVLTVVGLAFGASIGREGPTVQLGACIMFLIGSYFGLRQRSGIVLAGAAAGVAGAFNTPLAGIVFAVEELAKSYDRRASALVIAAVAIAGITSIMLAGNYHYFGTVNASFQLPWYWTIVPVCAVFGGIIGGAFSAAIVHVAYGRSQFIRTLKSRPFLFATICGLIVAVLGVATDGYVNGTSYHATQQALETGIGPPWWYGFAKLLATLSSSVSGIPGGLFSPSLSVGAALGECVSWLFPDVPPGMIFMLMMAAYFSAVVQAPLTAFIIVTEMTADTSTAVPLILVTLIASAVSRLFCPVPLYHALSHNY